MATEQTISATDAVEAKVVAYVRCGRCGADTFEATRYVRLSEAGDELEKARDYRCVGCNRIRNFEQIRNP